jgi:hypothetical protein
MRSSTWAFGGGDDEKAACWIDTFTTFFAEKPDEVALLKALVKALEKSHASVKPALEIQDGQDSIGSKQGGGICVDKERCSRVHAKRGGRTHPAHRQFKRVSDCSGFPDTGHNDNEFAACEQSRHGQGDRR